MCVEFHQNLWRNLAEWYLGDMCTFYLGWIQGHATHCGVIRVLLTPLSTRYRRTIGEWTLYCTCRLYVLSFRSPDILLIIRYYLVEIPLAFPHVFLSLSWKQHLCTLDNTCRQNYWGKAFYRWLLYINKQFWLLHVHVFSFSAKPRAMSRCNSVIFLSPVSTDLNDVLERKDYRGVTRDVVKHGQLYPRL